MALAFCLNRMLGHSVKRVFASCSGSNYDGTQMPD